MSNTSSSEISSSNTLAVCANCGKEGSEVSNTCNKCKMVMYCNAACKKKHRHKHKKACERRVAEIHDEMLFKQPPPDEDCPICMIRLPTLSGTGQTYMMCCGKVICSGCVHAFRSRVTKKEHDVCPFCRSPMPTSVEGVLKRLKKRIDLNDSKATNNMGCHYAEGKLGLPQNRAKALDLWHRAGELGSAGAYFAIGNVYKFGDGVEVDEKKAIHYWELAAMGGHRKARHNLGVTEWKAGNRDRALKHWMIAVKYGNNESLKTIQRIYLNKETTKDEYAKALRLYQAYLDEIKSDQRDEAAVSKGHKYYESAF